MKTTMYLFCVVVLSLAVVTTPLWAEDHDRAHSITNTSDHSDWPSGLTDTELGYVNGVTSAIQTQLNAKAPSNNPVLTGVVTIPNGSAAVPSLTFNGDTDTGLYRPVNDVVGVASYGYEAVRFFVNTGIPNECYMRSRPVPADMGGTVLTVGGGDAGGGCAAGGRPGGLGMLIGGNGSTGATDYPAGDGGGACVNAGEGANVTGNNNGGPGGNAYVDGGIGGTGRGAGFRGGDGGDVLIHAGLGGGGLLGASAGDDGIVRIDTGGTQRVLIGNKTTVNTGLDVSTTTGALIVPRMTEVQRDALTAVNGMVVYNTTDNEFNFYENGSWVTK